MQKPARTGATAPCAARPRAGRRAGGRVGHGAITGAAHRLHQRRRAGAQRIPAHQRERGGAVHARLEHAVDPAAPSRSGRRRRRSTCRRRGIARLPRAPALGLREGRERRLVERIVERAQIVVDRARDGAFSHGGHRHNLAAAPDTRMTRIKPRTPPLSRRWLAPCLRRRLRAGRAAAAGEHPAHRRAST